MAKKNRRSAAARSQPRPLTSATQSAPLAPAGKSQPRQQPVHRSSRMADIEAGRRARARRSNLRLALFVAPVVVLAGVLLITSGAFLGDIGQAAPNEGGVGVHLADGAALPQRNRPPSSGPHYEARASYGVSSEPVEPGAWVHALEHGGIAILFKCEDAASCESIAAQVDQQVYANAREGRFGERKLVGTPYQEMDTLFAAVAWGRVLPLETLDAEQILRFYDRYLDRGPENAS